MFLHIGEGEMILTRDIVLIGDLETVTDSEITREFFKTAEEEGFIVDYSEGKPRSYIMTGETIYLSMISSSTLAKRLNNKPGEIGGF